MLDKLLSASPESLFFGTLFLLVMLISKLANKRQWGGNERRESIFTDKQRQYIDEIVRRTIVTTVGNLSDMKQTLLRIEGELKAQDKRYNELDTRVRVHEARNVDAH